MREIKFRAWDTENKRYWWNVQDAYDGLGNHHTPDLDADKTDFNDELYVSSFGELLHSDDYTPEQYTGLKDKNGVEIYEGDIVDCGDRSGYIKYETKTDYPGFYLILPGDGGCYYFGSDYEVIGNIHENPELIR